MPRPTFMQSVLRKPTRSYADPYATSPWADYGDDNESESSYPASRYSSRIENGVHLGFQKDDGRHGVEAGPSRPRARGPSSTVSASAMSDAPAISLGTRFPKPARKVASSVGLRDGALVHHSPAGSAVGATRRKKESLPTYDEHGAKLNSVKKKKKKPRSVMNDNASSVLSSPTSTMSLTAPPPIHSRHSETSSSAASSPVPPLSPVVAIQHRSVPPAGTRPVRPTITITKDPLAFATPSSSGVSSYNLSTTVPPPIRITTVPPPVSLKDRRLSTTSAQGETDDEDEVFYTPRSSLDLNENTPTETATTPKPVPQLIAPPPSFNFLPPTPAPLPDPKTSPFHSEPTSSNSSSLHPDRPISLRPSPTLDFASAISSDPRLQPHLDDDGQSASGQAGSDDEYEAAEREPRSRQPSGTFSRPHSQAWSRPPSMDGRSAAGRSTSSVGNRPVSRQSTTRSKSRNAFDDFIVHQRPSRPTSEASFGSAPIGEGSMRGSISGYGKGGWAAAAASSAKSRSGASTPVTMFMPAGGDGWTNFQQAPVRQSRFTPLPAASQLATFDKLLNGARPELGGNSVQGSQNGLRPPSRDSSPSEYSQMSDGPVPSRSYLNREYSSEASQSSRLSDTQVRDEGLRQVERYDDVAPPLPPAPGSLAFPVARIPSMQHHEAPSTTSRPPSRAMSQPASPRPMSPTSYYSRPSSPNPASQTPRSTFNPPSFLNPDLLTILPEMTAQDSDKTYLPTPSESGKSRRKSVQEGFASRRSSMFRAKSEIGIADQLDDDDDVPELPPRRSRSVMGFRREGGGSKWEGSSHGEGVLLESHGRDHGGNGGYTNLFLPTGAYIPANPIKAANEISSRSLGMPHATMASITLSTTFHRHGSATPAHLRDQLPPLVDFTSHLKPPTKVGSSQLLVQIYAVAVDHMDIKLLEEKGRGDIGKWVPGRSFVGRALVVGTDEKEVVRGDIVMGILDVKKSGALSEYILVDRRRISRAPFPTQLSLEQLSVLPLQGIPAARAVRSHTTRHSRALIMNAHIGIGALICQELSRAGVNVTAVIAGGDDSHDAHRQCLANGAKGVLMGSPAAVMINMEESGWDLVFDDRGGQRVYDTARRMLKDGGKLVSTQRPESTVTSPPPGLTSRPSGLKTLRAAFGSKRKESKFISFEYLPPVASGEPEVDSSGMDYRDVMEEPCMAIFRPMVDSVVPFEKGAEAFKRAGKGSYETGEGSVEGKISVVRLIN
ncbi:hypothetical protein CI109_101750 [Kwoniella shandongensis]|uniref:Uncharacterized protein n=1 Tax=Kwoniella shandongensis TaxID=1734106 RepID=A0A5M6C5A4_9TREE|nr:uncharacterized protein CI109_001128 [Kwoniella shandongensis]KAA5530327.1 hypothetical protein CI109_001128 [Kwoniella shandongensis]